MDNNSSRNNTIAKNTFLLYLRSLFGLAVSLYTSRIVLNSLGIDDYGIYNVVGGMVAMFSLLSNSLSTAISRYLTFELGKENIDKLRTIFSSSVVIQTGLALFILLLVEIFGICFLNLYINIPAGRLEAAHWALQCSAITFAVGLISIPYNATIIAHEKMVFFAYISILEQVLKLIVAYLLYISPFDKLKIYAFLLVIVSILIRAIYGMYCKRQFEECNGKIIIDKSFIRQMVDFAGWNFLGAGSGVLMTQGVNILMNLFFTVAVNAARGVATQIEGVVMSFVNNFTTAINPQITKSYASGDREYLFQLIHRGSKYSFFLVLFFALPILLETETILTLWLGFVPVYTSQFVRLSLLVALLSVISNTLVTSMLATGNIKKYQIVVGGTGMLVFPLVYIAYYIEMPPATSYVITFLIFMVQLFYRLFLLHSMIQLSIRSFFKHVLLKDVYVLVLSSIVPIILHLYLPIENGLFKLLIICFASALTTILSIYCCGCDPKEKAFIRQKLSIFKRVIL